MQDGGAATMLVDRVQCTTESHAPKIRIQRVFKVSNARKAERLVHPRHGTPWSNLWPSKPGSGNNLAF